MENRNNISPQNNDSFIHLSQSPKSSLSIISDPIYWDSSRNHENDLDLTLSNSYQNPPLSFVSISEISDKNVRSYDDQDIYLNSSISIFRSKDIEIDHMEENEEICHQQEQEQDQEKDQEEKQEQVQVQEIERETILENEKKIETNIEKFEDNKESEKLQNIKESKKESSFLSYFPPLLSHTFVGNQDNEKKKKK